MGRVGQRPSAKPASDLPSAFQESGEEGLWWQFLAEALRR